jgi:hypothetical protein
MQNMFSVRLLTGHFHRKHLGRKGMEGVSSIDKQCDSSPLTIIQLQFMIA